MKDKAHRITAADRLVWELDNLVVKYLKEDIPTVDIVGALQAKAREVEGIAMQELLAERRKRNQ